MKKSKIEFISNLLAHKNISVEEKERLFSLTKNEIQKMGDDEDEKIKEITARIEKLEKGGNIAVVSSKINDSEQKTPQNKISLPKPRDTLMFLNLFRDSDGLKYLTHNFNSDKPDYDEFIRVCRKEFDDNKKKYPNANDKLLRRVEEFAFKTDPNWFIRKGEKVEYIKMGWSEPDFVEWYKNPNNNHPENHAKWKKKMIDPFKETIQVRAGMLADIIDKSLKYSLGEDYNKKYNVNFDKASLNSANFYTDVDLFQLALLKIFKSIKTEAERKENISISISIDYKIEESGESSFKKIIISHIGSEARKSSNDPSFAGGDLTDITKNLWSLCNYEIEAKFTDGYHKRIFLSDENREYWENVKKHVPIPIKEVAGFTHILKFY